MLCRPYLVDFWVLSLKMLSDIFSKNINFTTDNTGSWQFTSTCNYQYFTCACFIQHMYVSTNELYQIKSVKDTAFLQRVYLARVNGYKLLISAKTEQLLTAHWQINIVPYISGIHIWMRNFIKFFVVLMLQLINEIWVKVLVISVTITEISQTTEIVTKLY